MEQVDPESVKNPDIRAVLDILRANAQEIKRDQERLERKLDDIAVMVMQIQSTMSSQSTSTNGGGLA